jgi:hypothetical protein
MRRERATRARPSSARRLDEPPALRSAAWTKGMGIMVCLGALASVSAGCGSAEDPAASASEPLTTECVTIRRGLFGAVADAEIRLDKPGKNYGALNDMQVGAPPGGTERRSLLRFELDFIPPFAKVLSAEVTLKGGNHGFGTINLHTITAPWDEATVTWDSFDLQFTPAAQGSFDASAFAAGQTTFDLSALAQAWVNGAANHGILLKKGIPSGSVATFGASEHANLDKRPALEICFQDLCNDVSCDAPDACHLAGTCDPESGLCVYPLAPEGTPCDDGLACSVGDACLEGACVAGDRLECQAGPPLDPSCSPCVAQVCAMSPYCCTSEWDEKCAVLAKATCAETCPGHCGDALCAAGETCGGCPHDCGSCPPPPPTCVTCVQALNGLPGPLCPSTPPLLDAMLTCMCTEICPAACGSFCTGGPPFPGCLDCIFEGCAPALDACINDQPPPPLCGDGACVGNEACGSCPADCGPCATCPPPLTPCPAANALFCANLDADPWNCGACANACLWGESCVAGSCTVPVCGDLVCAGTESCLSCPGDCGCACHGECSSGAPQMPSCSPCVGQVCSIDPFCCTQAWDALCVDEAFKLCGLCAPVCGDVDCGLGETCFSCPDDCGACPPCPPPLVSCGPSCADLQNDPGNCGACDNSCIPGQLCQSGVCSGGGCGDGVCVPGEDCKLCPGDCGPCPPPVCPPGLTPCPSGCVDLNDDPMNCGQCGVVCAPFTCTMGVCI